MADERAHLERLITLTDAVVAIAMTLLVLPLVEITGEIDTDDLWGSLREHSDLIGSFVISFLVIYVFWAAHSGAFERLNEQARRTPALRLLNMWWLLVIAFLPFPTALAGRDLTTTSAPFYVGTMLVLSALTSAIAVVVDRATGIGGTRVVWPWATTVVFALCTVIAAFNADLGMYSLLLLVAVRIAEGRLRRPALTQEEAP